MMKLLRSLAAGLALFGAVTAADATTPAPGQFDAGFIYWGNTSLSQLLDSFYSNAQGSIIYRGASGWTALAPGSSGQFLKTQGAAANPLWATPAGGGNVSNSGTPASPQIAQWTNSTTIQGATLTSLIDAAFGSTQGDILYRNAAGWTVLAPGTSGWVLQSGGAAANPSWVAASGGGNVSNSGTPTSGQLGEWVSSTGLAGITLGGDCTFASPNITCLKTNGASFGALSTVTAGSGVATAAGNGVNASGGFMTFAMFAANNTWSGSNTYGEVIGGNRTVSGATDTLSATDCGQTVDYTSSSAITVTIPATLPVDCHVSIVQAGTAKVSVNGSAVTPATLHSAHSYTGTSAQWAMILIRIDTNAGGSSAVAILAGDGS